MATESYCLINFMDAVEFLENRRPGFLEALGLIKGGDSCAADAIAGSVYQVLEAVMDVPRDADAIAFGTGRVLNAMSLGS